MSRAGAGRAGVPRSLGAPRPVRVRMGAGGRPEVVDGRRVESVRESWLIEDRWWTASPVRRRYWEVVTADGRNVVVFRELAPHDGGGARMRSEGRWFEQRA